MSKRSEFAQKLLDDLRLRKERMAVAQSSTHSNAAAANAHGLSRKANKGSRQISQHQNISSRKGSIYAGNKSAPIKDASQQIVPFQRGRSSEQIGDLSMALAFALENGGKLRHVDSSGSSSMIGFLQQIGKGSVDFGKSSLDKHRPSTSRFPTFSHLHINEISKGAQKLNQILKACSNGVTFDRYSIEIGKELFKGAMDLEESLRMLVHLQEASEYMVTPQRKNRIRLLEDDEDDEDNNVKVAEQKQLDRPRFSFDKPLRSSHGSQEGVRTGLKQKLMALTYHMEAPTFNHEQRALITSNSVSHKRSASSGANSKTLASISELKNHSGSTQAKPEKKGLPNVIAKLMGLEELPEHVSSKNTTLKESNTKKKIEGMVLKKTTQGSSKIAEPKTKETENLQGQGVKQKAIQTNKILVTQDPAFVRQEDINLLARNPSFKMIVHDEKRPWKGLISGEGLNPVKRSKIATINSNKQQSNINQTTGSRKDIQDREMGPGYAKQREQKRNERGETKEPVLKDNMRHIAPQMHTSPETSNVLQENSRQKESTNRLLSGNQQKPQQTARQRLHVSKESRSEAISAKSMNDMMDLRKKIPYTSPATSKGTTEAINAMPSKRSPIIRHQENLDKESSFTNLKVNMRHPMNRNSDQNASSKYLETESDKAKVRIRPIMEEKHVQVLPSRKKVHDRMHKNETARDINVVTRTIRTTHNMARPLKDQNSVLQYTKNGRKDKIGNPKGAEQENSRRSKDEEIHITRSNKSEANIQPLHVAQQLQKQAEWTSTMGSPVESECSPVESECRSLKEPHTLAPTDSCQNITSEVSGDQQGQELAPVKDQEPKSLQTVSSPLNGTHEESMQISFPSQLEPLKKIKLETQEPLTEKENHLKQILMKNQLFLNTAEALFKLDIPFGILHASEHNCQDEDSKLILDCAYEIIKSRGRRQELTVHPGMKIPITSVKIRSLDNLVKQVHKDFETLQYYGRKGGNECDAADYLLKMLQRDVQNREPDMNCMWDFGWNEKMFAFIEKNDIIRDVEKQVLNGLIDEITRDLYI